MSKAKFTFSNGKVELENSNEAGKYLQQNYFPDLQIEDIFSRSQPNARTASGENPFTEDQLEFISEIDQAMSNLTSAEEFYELVEDFRNKVISNSGMSNEQKFEILALVEYSNSLHEFLINGGLTEIKELLPENTSYTGRVEDDGNNRNSNKPKPKYLLTAAPTEEGGGCSVNWRNVWAGAVVGLALGAYQGATAAGVAGTVVFPVVGTVTGAVSGGVVGGAFGYITGAATSVATELLTSCGRQN